MVGALFVEREWLEASARSLAPRERPSEHRQNKIAEFCRRHQQVIGRMPLHPQTEGLLEDLTMMWRAATGLSKDEALEKIILEYKDSPLGLTALQSYAASGRGGTFCEILSERHPNARVACMALDYRIKAAPAQEQQLLDQVLLQSPESKLAAFALTRKGQIALDNGDREQAAKCWLRAWLIDPARARTFFNSLCLIWLQSEDWDYPLLLSTENLADPVLNRIKERALAAMENSDPALTEQRARVREIGHALDENDTKKSLSLLQQLAQSSGGLDAEDRAYLGTAAFLMDRTPSYLANANIAESIQSHGEWARCREQLLAWGQQGYDALHPDVRAMLVLRLVGRWLEDARVAPAITLLQATWRAPSISKEWRELLVNRLVNLLIEEYADNKLAGAVCAEYCDSADTPSPTLCVRSATLLNQVAEYDRSLDQLKRLDSLQNTLEVMPVAAFLRALNYMGKGEMDRAGALLEAFSENYPQSDLAPQAVEMLARIALAKGDQQAAAAHYRTIMQDYSQSRYAKTARQEYEKIISQ